MSPLIVKSDKLLDAVVLFTRIEGVGQLKQVGAHFQILGRANSFRVAFGEVAQGRRLEAFRSGAEQAKGFLFILLAAVAMEENDAEIVLPRPISLFSRPAEPGLSR